MFYKYSENGHDWKTTKKRDVIKTKHLLLHYFCFVYPIIVSVLSVKVKSTHTRNKLFFYFVKKITINNDDGHHHHDDQQEHYREFETLLQRVPKKPKKKKRKKGYIHIGTIITFVLSA